MGNGRIRFRHSTIIGEARELASYLDKNVPEARYIADGNTRGSHVRPGTREPRVLQTPTSVRVLHKQSGQMQFLFIFPETGVDLATLTRRVTASLQQREHRGGVGQSSNEAIRIPDRIRRLQMKPRAVAPPAPSVSDQQHLPASALPPAVPRVAEKRVLRWWHEAYERLLTLDPSGQALQFPVGGIAGALRQWYPNDKDVKALVYAFKNLGFISFSPDEFTGRHGRERVAFVHRVTGYTIVERERPQRRSEAQKDTAPAQPTPGASATFLGELMDELQTLLAKAHVQHCSVTVTTEGAVVTSADGLMMTKKT